MISGARVVITTVFLYPAHKNMSAASLLSSFGRRRLAYGVRSCVYYIDYRIRDISLYSMLTVTLLKRRFYFKLMLLIYSLLGFDYNNAANLCLHM